MTIEIELRDVEDADYAIFFEHRSDEGAARMAAFGTKSASASEMAARLKKSVAEGTTTCLKTVLHETAVIGLVAVFLNEGKPEVTYWIARSHWGRGVATAALTRLLELTVVRPIYASAAKDNVASLRVLEKCGFTLRGSGRAFASARSEEIDEIFLELRC